MSHLVIKPFNIYVTQKCDIFFEQTEQDILNYIFSSAFSQKVHVVDFFIMFPGCPSVCPSHFKGTTFLAAPSKIKLCLFNKLLCMH